MLDPIVNAQQFTNQRAQYHTDNKAEQFLGFYGAHNSDQDCTETECLHDAFPQRFFDVVAEQDTDKAACKNRESIDKYREHVRLLLFESGRLPAGKQNDLALQCDAF